MEMITVIINKICIETMTVSTGAQLPSHINLSEVTLLFELDAHIGEQGVVGQGAYVPAWAT